MKATILAFVAAAVFAAPANAAPREYCGLLKDLLGNCENSRSGRDTPSRDRPNKPDKPNPPSKPDKPDAPNKPDVPNKPDRPDRPNKPDRPDRPDTPSKPDRPDAPGKPDKDRHDHGKGDHSAGNGKGHDKGKGGHDK